MEILPVAATVAILNGLFLLLSRSWADRKLADARQQHERDLEHLKAGLSALRDFALKHFDRRASLYWEALEPFIDLYVITSQGPASASDAATFHRRALGAAARVHLFAPDSVRQCFDEMLEWTEAGLRREHEGGASLAEGYAHRFVQAAHQDLLSVPSVPKLPGV